MKKIQKILGLLVFAICSQEMQAKKSANKQQIFFTNEYGDDVTVKLTWKSKNFPYFSNDEIIDLREHDHDFMSKAAYSYYKLVGLSASPKDNNSYGPAKEMSIEDFDAPIAPINEDILDEKHVKNHTHFTIKASHKDSAVPGQKKIYIQGHNGSQQKAAQPESKKANLQEVKKMVMPEPVQIPATKISPVMNNNSEQQVINEQPMMVNQRIAEISEKQVPQNVVQKLPIAANLNSQQNFNDPEQMDEQDLEEEEDQRHAPHLIWANSQPINLPYSYHDAL
jgi:hypothetical protein